MLSSMFPCFHPVCPQSTPSSRPTKRSVAQSSSGVSSVHSNIQISKLPQSSLPPPLKFTICLGSTSTYCTTYFAPTGSPFSSHTVLFCTCIFLGGKLFGNSLSNIIIKILKQPMFCIVTYISHVNSLVIPQHTHTIVPSS